MSDHVRLEPCKRVRVRLGNETIIDTTRGYTVFERGLPPRYYVPRDEVRATIADSPSGSTCPWKGRWKHVDVTVGATRVPEAAWTYFETTPVCDPIRDFIAFYPGKVEALEVE